jgi:hypothetical protein
MISVYGYFIHVLITDLFKNNDKSKHHELNFDLLNDCVLHSDFAQKSRTFQTINSKTKTSNSMVKNSANTG